MQTLFLREAGKYHVLPLDDRVFERLDAQAVGRPDLMGGRTSMTLSEGMTGMMEAVFVNVKNRSKVITAEVEVPASGGNGTVIAQGGRFGGWSLYVKDGVPAYHYNFLGLQRFTVASTKKLAPGKSTVVFQFDYDGGGPAKGGKGTLLVNGQKVGEGRIGVTQPGLFSADETADVGIDLGTPVVEAIGAEAKRALHRTDSEAHGRGQMSDRTTDCRRKGSKTIKSMRALALAAAMPRLSAWPRPKCGRRRQRRPARDGPTISRPTFGARE